MTEEEKEICIGRRSGKTYNKIQEMAKEIVRLQKELEEKTTILMTGAEKVKQLEKENKELKEENAILEGNKIGLKLAIQELKEDNSHQWEERCRLTFELEELKEELDYYKQKENQEFDERDYYEE